LSVKQRHKWEEDEPDAATAFRKRLHFIVITVITVTLPLSMGFLRDGS
jgi:hypothetical protein